MNTNEKIALLRAEMAKKGLDAYIVYSSDAHQSEYVADCWKSRTWLTGFTGSAGTALVTKDFAALWADGRYFIQAANEIAGSEFQLMKMAIPGFPTLPEWLAGNLPDRARIGFDGRTVSHSASAELERTLKIIDAEFVGDFDLINEIWTDRPALPFSTVYPHELRFAGKSFAEKLSEVRSMMASMKASSYFLSSMDDIAWLFNLRGDDVSCNPVFHAYALLTDSSATLFIDEKRLTPDAKDILAADHVAILPYEQVTSTLSGLKGGKVYFDPDRTSILHSKALSKENEISEGLDFTAKLKGIKNPTEIELLRKTHAKDSVAVTRFMYWLKTNSGKIPMDEISVDDKLTEFRSHGEHFKGKAFNTIAAYKENAAMMHYSATPEKKATIRSESFLLVDSGGQYLDGTTDITRTFSMGPLTEEEKKDFTLVVKSHIGLARPRFLAGTTGGSLDILARTPMWNEGLDYKCGSGHGVGFFLNVHEGPHSFKPIVKTPLEPGMVITNEPGVYKENRHGIRIENTQLVVEDIVTEFGGTFYTFETLSFVPIDLDGLIPEMLNEEERRWLNDYHETCRKNLMPHMKDEAEKVWLEQYTRAI